MPQQLQRREGSQRRSSMDSSAAPAELTPSPSNDLRRRDSITSTAIRRLRDLRRGLRSFHQLRKTRDTALQPQLSHHPLHHRQRRRHRPEGGQVRAQGIDLDGFGVSSLPSSWAASTIWPRSIAMRQPSTARPPSRSACLIYVPRNETDSSDSIDEASALSAPTRDNAGGCRCCFGRRTAHILPSHDARSAWRRSESGCKLLGKFKRFSLNVRPASSSGATSAFGPDSAATQDRATGSGSSNSHNFWPTAE